MLHGGPFDGLAVAGGRMFRWFDAQGGGHAEPGKGRVLYKFARGRYEYAGEGATKCPECYALLAPHDATPVTDTCPLCGANLRDSDRGTASDPLV
jgi:hypothetical protein